MVIYHILANYSLLFRVSEEETLEMSDMDHSASEDHKELEEKPKKKKRRRREIDMVDILLFTSISLVIYVQMK